MGICAAWKIPGQTVESFRHCLSPLSYQSFSSSNASKSAVEENIQVSNGAKHWFSDWHNFLATFVSETDEVLPNILNLGLAVAFLRDCRKQFRTINREDLTILWDFIHKVLISPRSPFPLSTVFYDAEGFFIIPICTLTGRNGEGDELYRLHAWLPDSQRDPDFCIHSCQAAVQIWVLAGDVQCNTFKVESASNFNHATHAELQLANDVGHQNNKNQNESVLRTTGRMVHAVKTQSSVQIPDTSHCIEPGTWHTLEVAPDALHASIFLLNPRAASEVDTRVLGPKNVDHRVQPPRKFHVTPALLASNINSIRLWEILLDEGKWHARRSEMEDALRVFHTALSRCNTFPGFPNANHYARIVHGELGFTNRCLGRYNLAKEHLEEALKDKSPSRHRVKANGELGTVFRAQNRMLDARNAFQAQYDIAKALGDHRSACRAIGNLGMSNYQLFEQQHDNARLELAIEQLKERVDRARQLKRVLITEEMHPRERFARLKHASVWESVGLNRLSLCYTAQGNTEGAIGVAKESQDIKIEPKDPTVIAMSHFFYGRALLRGGQREAAMEHFDPSVACTPAIALCKEPSKENCGYLQELVGIGVDMGRVDEYGYTALDYAVFGEAIDMEEIVIQGLRHTLKRDVESEIFKLKYEARLRKSYRGFFHDKMRPVLLEGGADTLKNLRVVYASALAAEEKVNMAPKFGMLKCVRYSDFLRCGRLPRHSDGYAKDPSSTLHASQGPAVDFIIFFSYRWINREANRSSPDDEKNTQYHRMVEATREFLKIDPAVDPERLGIWLVRRRHQL